MATLAEARQQYPFLADLDDEGVVDAIHQAFYADMPREKVAESFGLKPAPAPTEKSGFMRRALGDTGISLLKGVIGVPEAIVGAADIPTMGYAGKVAESLGFRPKEAKDMLDEGYSPEQKEANAKLAAAKGWVDTAATALTNPSTILHSAIESAPSLLPAGAVGRGVLKVLPKVGSAVAGGVGEGVVSAGQTAEQVRQEDPTGTLTPGQAGIAAASGALTAWIGTYAGKLANKLGIGDKDQMLLGVARAKPEVQKSFVRKMLEGAVVEGALQEFPQSLQEQVAQNIMQGKPLDQGIENAALMGMFAGGLMGGAVAPLHGHDSVSRETTPPDPRGLKQPETGPMTKALNRGLEDAAQARDAGAPPPVVPPDPNAEPAPLVLPDVTPEQEAQLLAHANKRMAELAEKEKGTKDQTITGPDGEKMTIAGKQPEFLTPEEKAERDFLKEHGGNAKALNQLYERDTESPVDAALTRMHEQAAADLQGTRQYSATDRPPKKAEPAAAEATDEPNLWQPGDVLNGQGAPFKNKTAVLRAQKGLAEPTSHDVVEVQGGWVLRPVANQGKPAGGIARPAPATQVADAAPAPADKPVAKKADSGSDGDARPAVVPAKAEPAAPATAAGGDGAPLILSIEGKGSKGAMRKLPDGTRQRLMVSADGTHYWGEYNEVIGPDGKHAVEGANADGKPAEFPTSKEARAAAQALQDRLDGKAPAPKAEPTAAEKAAAADEQRRLERKAKAEAKAAPVGNALGALEEHITQKGKTLKGWWRKDLSERQAKAIDGGAFQSTGKGWFIRERAAEALAHHDSVVSGQSVKPAPRKPVTPQVPSTITSPLGVAPPKSATGFTEAFDSLKGGGVTEKLYTGLFDALKAGETTYAGIKDPILTRARPAFDAGTIKSGADLKAHVEAGYPAPAPKPDISVDRVNELQRWGDEADARERAGREADAALARAAAPSANTIFTEDAAAAAREVLKRKLGINTGKKGQAGGIDPEVFSAGITLAGYHVERGARTFAAFSKAMLADLGEAIRPYLKQLYMALKFDPRAAAIEGMDSAASVEGADVAAIEADSGPAPAVAGTPGTDETTGKETSDATAAPAAPAVDRPGERPLEGAPTEAVRSPDEGGDARPGPDAGGGSDGQGNADAAGAGAGPRPGLGNDAGAAPVSGGGTGGKPRGTAKPRAPRASGRQSRPGLFDDAGGTAGSGVAPNAAAPAPRAFKPQDFTIADDLALGEGGQKAKFRGNIEAIRLLKQMQPEGLPASPDEQKVLARYVGWGGLPQAFDEKNADWAREFAELKGLLDDDEYQAARESTQYAHYTSREVIGGIYSALARLGFTGGKILEPGAGVGNFIGLMPAGLRTASRFTGVERENIAAGIAAQLYPRQNIQHADFAAFDAADGSFDAAIGNPPFAKTALTDQSNRKHLSGLSVHNYFFAKSVDLLREGGILAQVVSNSFLDAQKDTARRYIAERTRFLGAVRLPNNAFAKNAGTEVTTDIVFLQKLPEAEWNSRANKENRESWLDLDTVRDPKGGQPVPVNAYFAAHPNMMLGELGRFGTMYGPDQPALRARPGQDTAALFQAAIARLPENVYKARAAAGTQRMNDQVIEALQNPTVREGGHYLKDGKVYRRLEDDAGEARAVQITPETPWSAKQSIGLSGYERLAGLAQMRQTLRALLGAELAGEAGMNILREKLNQQYDAYVALHGLINDRPSARVFDDDPDFPLLASLEHNYTPGITPDAAKKIGVKPHKSSATKAPIFTSRVVDTRRAPTKAGSSSDALTISMAERGIIDGAYIGTLLGRDGDEVLRELAQGEKPLLFVDPGSEEYVLRDAYLSGNVRVKLEQAKAAGMYGNVRALEDVQPEDVGAHEISVRLGSPWVPESVYEDFAKQLFGEGTKASLHYVKANSSYMGRIAPGSNVAATNTWGTVDFPGHELLVALLNNRAIKVTYRDQDGNLRVDTAKTEAAGLKATDIKQAFSDWAFKDSARSEVLAKVYNETNNNYVTRAYDGGYLNFPGKVPDSVIKFRRHQRNAIARIVQDRTTLLDHVVGAGKTFTIVSATMELKRTGLANKSMVAVPNHLVKQWAADYYRLYPAANVLTATKKDFEKANRRKFLAKIATGDWDAVVIAHSSFGFIKPSPEFEERFNAEQVAQIVATIKAVEAETGDGDAKKRTVKQLAALKERLENRIKALRQKPMDALLDFKQIGIDQLFVDEAHLFKNLMFSTKMQNVRGLGDATGSQRAYDLYVKSQQLFEQNGRGQGLVFATGTPISNTLAEMYHMMRYLMPDAMKANGFDSFDAWANTFASVEQVWMQKFSGDGYKADDRMSSFVNVPELLKLFDQVADTVTMDDIKAAYREENEGREFPLPKLAGGKRTPVGLKKSPAQVAYMESIALRAKAIEGKRSEKGGDNPLTIMGDARKAAMDIRLVDPDLTEREPGGRIDRAATEIYSRWQKWGKWKGTQLVFSDLGTPLKHAKAEMKEWEALQARINAGSTQDTITSANLGNEAAMHLVDDAEHAQNELDAKGRDWLGSVKAALRGFSVYDDLRKALVERSVPEHEVAFIHDFNTDDQKASLFRKVNAGEIRVLIGSTPKLGAGTNVQERLVAEHHLDVPWKPSDVEQREGRIIRQGNALMLEVPDFEAEILAYVTEDTLDLRMWQIQEAKLNMINQLRMRNVGREIDNAFEEMAMSAGEMQAAATGNIDLLKEIQLRTDVKKLEQAQRSYDAQRSDLESRKRRADAALAELPAQVETAKKLAAMSQAYGAEISEHHAAFKATIDGKEYTSAYEAGLVLQALSDAKTYQRATVTGDGKKETLTISNEEFDALPEDKQALWKAKATDLSVTMNGKEYTARNALGEAFADLRGDVQGPPMWKVDGQTFIRRTLLAKAIAQRVLDAAADEKAADIGTVGGFKVTVEGQAPDRMGNRYLEIVVEGAGEQLSASIPVPKGGTEDDARKLATNAVNSAQALAQGNTLRAQYLQSDLERAQRTRSEIEKAGAMPDWPNEGKLTAARLAHRDVLKRLSAKKAEDGAAPEAATDEPVASRGPASAGLPVAQLAAAMQRIVKQWKNAPKGGVHVVPSAKALPEKLRSTDETGEARAWFDPSTEAVYLIADKLGDDAQAQFALFHEVYGHYGMRAFLGDEFASTMTHLRRINTGLSMQASLWFLRYGRAEVAARVERGLSYEAAEREVRLLSTEEALADRAGEAPPASTMKFLLARLQRSLRAIGLDSVADWLEGHSNAEVLEMLVGARNAVQRGGRAHAFVDTVPAASRGNTLDALRELGTRQGIGHALNDAFRSQQSFNGWWHRTVGTQYHKAQIDADFAKVYNAGQDYLHDTSAFANDAAALAPDLLPQLKHLSDIKRLAYSEKDREAMRAPVFEGTLAWTRDEHGELVEAGDEPAGVVFSDDELRERFKLSDQQIKLYREFRGAVDRSLDTLVASDVARYLGGKDLPQGLRDMVSDGDVGRFKGLVTALAQQKLDEAGAALVELLKTQKQERGAYSAKQKAALEEARAGGRLTIAQALEDEANALTAKHEGERASAEAARAKWEKLKQTIGDKYAKVESLKQRGYAPLMRFGRYTVTERTEDGEVTYFAMFESQRQANIAARAMRGAEGRTIEQGVMSQLAFKQFQGMTPETMELFAELAGVEQSDIFQQYLKLAIANRSALKRLIHRKGTAGYAEDTARVLAAFVTSNARGASGNLHLGQMSEAIAEIPKEKGDVIDEATKLREYVTTPQEEAQAVRGLLFANFIGGSIASAAVNLTQPVTMTLPYLSQFSNPAVATARVAQAMIDAVKGVAEPELKAALAKAEREGIVSPQEIHQLQAEATRGAGNNRFARGGLFVWGSLFSLAEQFNRRTTFIAAWRTAPAGTDAFAFATDAVDATQGVYNKGNKPNWARGAVGGTLFTFKQFSISYLELLKRLPAREKMLALAILMLTAGAQGLPGADDLDDLVDSLAQGLGYDWNSKQQKTRFLTSVLGQGAADFVLRGASALPGVPLDVAGRMSLGNLIPATGVFLKSKQDKGQEIAEALGPVGGLAQGVGKAMKGDVMGLAPTAIQNLGKALDMLRTGMYRDAKGRKVIETDTTDAVMKGIGFQPAEVARESRKVSIGMQQVQLAKAEQTEITHDWAEGIFEKDEAKVEAARKKLRDWNATNPESRIIVSRPALVSQVRNMNLTREQRFIKAAPKAMRPTVLAE